MIFAGEFFLLTEIFEVPPFPDAIGQQVSDSRGIFGIFGVYRLNRSVETAQKIRHGVMEGVVLESRYRLACISIA